MDRVKDGSEQKDYYSYLLRMWRDSGDEGAAPSKKTLWRASLQDPHTGQRAGFANLEKLFSFLRRETGESPDGKTEAS